MHQTAVKHSEPDAWGVMQREWNILLIEGHFELHLSQSSEVLSSTDSTVAVGIIVQKAVQGRGEFLSIEIPIACDSGPHHSSLHPLPHTIACAGNCMPPGHAKHRA